METNISILVVLRGALYLYRLIKVGSANIKVWLRKHVLLGACNLGYIHNLKDEHNGWLILRAHIIQVEGQVKICHGCSPYVYYVFPPDLVIWAFYHVYVEVYLVQ